MPTQHYSRRQSTCAFKRWVQMQPITCNHRPFSLTGPMGARSQPRLQRSVRKAAQPAACSALKTADAHREGEEKGEWVNTYTSDVRVSANAGYWWASCLPSRTFVLWTIPGYKHSINNLLEWKRNGRAALQSATWVPGVSETPLYLLRKGMDLCMGTHRVSGMDRQTSGLGLWQSTLWPHLYLVIKEVEELIHPGYGSRKEVSEKLIIPFLAQNTVLTNRCMLTVRTWGNRSLSFT